ncbi:flagellar hook-associated protein 3 [Capsulimonas corticalis]|uniref:Flagellar hook-associated protein 3 n=1 Tax=Capsulimonas corticalis TaxID=2219043 RepID=A0A402CS97_9BACT|nr:flagellar hook-associated protein FlgL [Capsulimonas corticalis]BDI28298.1 flagellar hook-associated protein 3 [Capsulimonas corticalis]
MRVTSSLIAATLAANVETSLSNLNAVSTEISTGKKLNNPSDDPAGAAYSMSLRASLVDNTQYQTNAAQAKTFLNATDSALSDVSNAILSARQIASAGANSTQTPDSLAALSAQVDGIISSVIQSANSDVHGKYLFSGTETKTAPYIDDATAHSTGPVYQGNTGSVTATVGKNNNISISTPGSAVFSGLFATLNDLKANLASGDINAMSADLGKLDTNLSTVSSVRANVGAQVNTMTSVTQNLTRAETSYKDAIANVEEVDLAQAYVQLQSAQNVYQASLVAVSKGYQHSLSDYL